MNHIKPLFSSAAWWVTVAVLYYNEAPGAGFNSSLFKIGGYRRPSVSLDILFLTNINFKSLIPAPGYQYPAILSQKIPATPTVQN